MAGLHLSSKNNRCDQFFLVSRPVYLLITPKSCRTFPIPFCRRR